MTAIRFWLYGCQVQRVHEVVQIRSGQYKREMDIRCHNQNYHVDQLVVNPEEFEAMDMNAHYHFHVYFNGIQTPRGNVNHLLISNMVKSPKVEVFQSEFNQNQ